MPPELDVLCCGLAIADFVFDVPHHPASDEKVRASGRLVCGGGPAANAAAQVARLGGRAALLARVGPDALGAQLRAELAADGVDTRWLVTDADPTSVAVLLVKPNGDRGIVYHRPFRPSALPEPDVRTARVLLVDNHEPETALRLAQAARRHGVPSVVDAGTCNDHTRALAAAVDHLVASADYARVALGAEPTPETIAALGGSAATVVVTLGARGVIWAHRGEHGSQPAFRVPVVDTTGAGDAFHGAYALALARDLPLAGRVRTACAVGALACTQLGGRPALPPRPAVAALLGEA